MMQYSETVYMRNDHDTCVQKFIFSNTLCIKSVCLSFISLDFAFIKEKKIWNAIFNFFPLS